MPESRFAAWIKRLFEPSPTRSIISLAGLGLALGVAGVIAFNATLHATSTEEFCLSCHTMAIPYAQLQKTSHYANAEGVRATCSDCHLPQEFVPKMIRKIEAAREVWGEITGIIDTPEKYAAHALAMKQREISRLQRNDSQECRNCHEADKMATELQTAKAQEYHGALKSKGKTCIDCHAGIAHPENTAGLTGTMDQTR